jgi:hypothetical protein
MNTCYHKLLEWWQTVYFALRESSPHFQQTLNANSVSKQKRHQWKKQIQQYKIEIQLCHPHLSLCKYPETNRRPIHYQMME